MEDSWLYYWRDYSGREVDWVLEYRDKWLPIEVKWSDTVKKSAAKHLHYFLESFPGKAEQGAVIFTGANPTRISDKVTAVPYTDLVPRLLKPFTA